MRTTNDIERQVREKWRLLNPTLDERQRRLWAGAEADAIGYGGVATVARATRLAISTVRNHGYSSQAPNKAAEGKQHPDRNAQFEHLNRTAETCFARGVPVISVDTKKKDLVRDCTCQCSRPEF